MRCLSTALSSESQDERKTYIEDLRVEDSSHYNPKRNYALCIFAASDAQLACGNDVGILPWIRHMRNKVSQKRKINRTVFCTVILR
jgi:hypothetical protein